MRYILRWGLLLLVVFQISFILFPQAVKANPAVIMTKEIEAGGLFIGHNVCMSESQVNIVIDTHDTMTFTLNSIFTLTSTTNQTILAGFAYPQEWDIYSSEVPNDRNCEFVVNQNQEPVNYVTLDFHEVIEKYNDTTGLLTIDDLSHWDWYEYVNFVSFNLSFTEEIPIELEVKASSSFVKGNTFKYCVGSAYSWSGTTHEVITLQAKNIGDSRLRSGDDVYEWDFLGFYPDTGLTETWNNTWATAVWDLTFHDDDDTILYVGFAGSYTSYWDPVFNTQFVLIATIVIFGIVISGIVFVRKWKFRFRN